MHRDPLQALVNLISREANPHHLVIRIVSDSALLKEAQRLCRKTHGVAAPVDRRIPEVCRAFKILPDYFQERLRLITQILNLIPYEESYYEILGVSQSASRQEIKQAFRRLSLSTHPDTNPDDPDAAERFLNIQHAYEVLSNDLLRQSYDRNLEISSWDEEEIRVEESAGQARWWKWRRAWPFSVLFVLLVLITFVIDYRQWQTEHYYRKMNGQPARMHAVPSLSPSSPQVEPAQESAQHTSTPPPAPFTELGKQPSSPPVFTNVTEETRPQEAMAIPSAPLNSDGLSTKSDVNSGSRRLETVPATSRPLAVDAKPSIEKPQATSGPTGSLSSLTKPNENPARFDGEPAELAQATVGARGAARPGTPDDSLAPEHLAQAQDVYGQIQMFVSRYTSAYEAKDLPALLRFFEKDAMENGKPIEELIPAYGANFQRAEKLRYRISIGRWEVGKEGVMLDGSFALFVKFREETPIESTGSIHLTLIRRSDGFGVKRLDYSFKEFRKNTD